MILRPGPLAGRENPRPHFIGEDSCAADREIPNSFSSDPDAELGRACMAVTRQTVRLFLTLHRVGNDRRREFDVPHPIPDPRSSCGLHELA
jgi:hypothetical protein